jgi:hypothetical protein
MENVRGDREGSLRDQHRPTSGASRHMLLRIAIFTGGTLFAVWAVFFRPDPGGGRVAGILVVCYLAWNVYRAYRQYRRSQVPSTPI